MIIARFFSGLAGSAFLSVAGGTVGDLFSRRELGAPMMVYTASPFIGPELGPLSVLNYPNEILGAILSISLHHGGLLEVRGGVQLVTSTEDSPGVGHSIC